MQKKGIGAQANKHMIKSFVIDTNILVRFVVGDNSEQLQKIQNVFRLAEKGKVRLLLPSLVFAEACFVLESWYKQKKSDIAEVFSILVSSPWIEFEERDALLQTLHNYSQGMHFVDAYLIAKSLIEQKEILTFDKKLKKLSFVQ